jgi:xanthosine utilization system XapX-like protein
MIGGLLFLVGWIWTIITAFKGGGTLWGVLNIIPCIQPLVGIISAVLKKAAWAPVALMIVGLILSLLGGDYSAVMNQMQQGR